jgi:hypothetical protein
LVYSRQDFSKQQTSREHSHQSKVQKGFAKYGYSQAACGRILSKTNDVFRHIAQNKVILEFIV